MKSLRKMRRHDDLSLLKTRIVRHFHPFYANDKVLNYEKNF